jgi:secreted PhoX family phosphatase
MCQANFNTETGFFGQADLESGKTVGCYTGTDEQPGFLYNYSCSVGRRV